MEKETKKVVVGIKDIHIGIVNVLVADTEGSAIRSFADACTNKEDNQFKKFPVDYSLVKLGELTIETGIIEPCIPNRTLTMATQYIQVARVDEKRDKE